MNQNNNTTDPTVQLLAAFTKAVRCSGPQDFTVRTAGFTLHAVLNLTGEMSTSDLAWHLADDIDGEVVVIDGGHWVAV